MLHVVVINRIPGEELGTVVVDEESSWLSDVLLKVMHKLLKPNNFLCSFSGSHIFGFSGGLRDT